MQFCFSCVLKKGHAREEAAYGDHDVHTLDLAKETNGCAHASVSVLPSLPPSSSPPATPRKQESLHGYMVGIPQSLRHLLDWLE